MRLRISILLAGLAGCTAVQPSGTILDRPTSEWRAAATPGDRERLRSWRSAFVDALRSARAAGHGAEIDREGVLLDPDAALDRPAIADGDYRCRVVKLGSKNGGTLHFVAYPFFRCRIETIANIQQLSKLTGSQRHVGVIFPDSATRQVFLGTLALGDETRAIQYGSDPERDLAGWVERIGERRWRLLLPLPAYESRIDVMELIPLS